MFSNTYFSFFEHYRSLICSKSPSPYVFSFSSTLSLSPSFPFSSRCSPHMLLVVNMWQLARSQVTEACVWCFTQTLEELASG